MKANDQEREVVASCGVECPPHHRSRSLEVMLLAITLLAYVLMAATGVSAETPANAPPPSSTPDGPKGSLKQSSAEIKDLNAQLIRTAEAIKKAEAEQNLIEDLLAALELKEKGLEEDLSQRKDEIGKLLSAIQRMGRNPPPVLITERKDAVEMVRSGILLTSAYSDLGEKARDLLGKLETIDRLAKESRELKDKLKTAIAQHTENRTKIAALLDAKNKTTFKQNPEIEKLSTTISKLTQETENIDELLKKSDALLTTTTSLGLYEAKLKRLSSESLGVGDPEATASDPAASPSVTSRKVVEIAPLTTASIITDTGRMEPARPFEQNKGNKEKKIPGKLPLPVQARQRILTFGAKTETGGTSRGEVYETRPGAQITSPCDGWVVYAGEFRSYGQLLIINAGGGYHIVLAGLSQIDVRPAQFVLAAEPVGTMNDAQTQDGKPANRPVLYVEFRKDHQPMDPDSWWAK